MKCFKSELERIKVMEKTAFYNFTFTFQALKLALKMAQALCMFHTGVIDTATRNSRSTKSSLRLRNILMRPPSNVLRYSGWNLRGTIIGRDWRGSLLLRLRVKARRNRHSYKV